MNEPKLCQDCGDPIPAKRLIAKPDAVYCVGCQEKLGDNRLNANSRSVRNALLERSERDGGQYQNAPEPHECLKLK